MTKEKLYELLLQESRYGSSDYMYFAESYLNKFFDSHVVIPKGENRHPYADVLHEWAEGTEVEWKDVSGSNIWNEFISVPDIQYRIKPKEPIYEWQWLCTVGGYASISKWLTEEEIARKYADPQVWLKIEETKRVRR